MVKMFAYFSYFSRKNLIDYDLKTLKSVFFNGMNIASLSSEYCPNVKEELGKIAIEEVAEDMEDIRRMAIEAFKGIDGKGLSRVDFFIDKDSGEIFINEINTLPGFTNISMYPKMWEATGLEYSKLIDRLIELALDSKK